MQSWRFVACASVSPSTRVCLDTLFWSAWLADYRQPGLHWLAATELSGASYRVYTSTAGDTC